MRRTPSSIIIALVVSLISQIATTGYVCAADGAENGAAQQKRKAGHVAADATIKLSKHAADMVQDATKFYIAVAVKTYWDCVSTQDPTYCENFLESLTDPATQIGFAAFAIGSQGASHGILALTGRKFAGGPLPMAAGVLMNDLVTAMAASPSWEALKHVGRIRDFRGRMEKRSELIAQLFNETVLDHVWWLDRVPSILSLSGAAMVAPILLKSARAGTQLAALGLENVSRSMFSSDRAALAFARARTAMASAVSGYEAFKKSGASLFRLFEYDNWIVLAIMSTAETVNFLNVADRLEQPIRKWWDESHAAENLAHQKAILGWMLDPAEHMNRTPEQIQEQVHTVEIAWDLFRKSQFIEPTSIYGEYRKNIDELEAPIGETYNNYVWILEGAPRDRDKMKQKMPEDWEPGGADDAANTREDFFCGVPPEETVKLATEFHGFVVPGRSDRARAFRVDTSRSCRLIRTPEIDDIGDYFRKRNIEQHDYSAELNEAYKKAMISFETARAKIYERYENRIQASAIESLTGINGSSGEAFDDYEFVPSIRSAVPKQNFKRGIIPSYLQEIAYWKSIKQDSAANDALHKLEAANGLLKFMRNPRDLTGFKISGSDACDDKECDELFNDDTPQSIKEWQQIVDNWKSFTMGQVNL